MSLAGEPFIQGEEVEEFWALEDVSFEGGRDGLSRLPPNRHLPRGKRRTWIRRAKIDHETDR